LSFIGCHFFALNVTTTTDKRGVLVVILPDLLQALADKRHLEFHMGGSGHGAP